MQQYARGLPKWWRGWLAPRSRKNRVTDRGIGSRQFESTPDTQGTHYPMGLQLGEAGLLKIPAGRNGRAFTIAMGQW